MKVSIGFTKHASWKEKTQGNNCKRNCRKLATIFIGLLLKSSPYSVILKRNNNLINAAPLSNFKAHEKLNFQYLPYLIRSFELPNF
jgi:hypothetical protein